MLRLISPITLVFLMLALAVPAAGLAQGAGDQQYSDPFSDSEGGGGGGGNSGSDGGGNSGSGESGSGNSGSGQAAPTDSGQSQGSTATQAPQTQTQTTAPQAAQGEQLPRTGYPAWLAALAGGVLLASGATLRVSLGLRR